MGVSGDIEHQHGRHRFRLACNGQLGGNAAKVLRFILPFPDRTPVRLLEPLRNFGGFGV
ncbi:hypothetical protein D3C76_846220 [compost metagenome]